MLVTVESPSPVPCLFGGKEGIENVALLFLGDSLPVVRHPEAGVVLLILRSVKQQFRLLPAHHPAAQAKMAVTAAHGVKRIGAEV